MNYRKKNYRGKRSYSGRPHRRTADSYHQPIPADQSRIPYSRHTLTKPDVEAVVDALLSGSLTQGRELERFESLLAKLTHSEYAIAFSSGTAGIHSALACLKLEPEDEVIVPTLTFSAVANMVRISGARIVLVDCDPQTHTLSVEGTRKAITENTKAIFTNNFAGHPSDLQTFREICDEHNLLLLEDASHGLGGKYRGYYVGNQADITCFSFHPSKAITTCEGGAVTTNNRAIAEWLRQFRHHGIQKDSRYFTSNETFPDYYQELQFSGMNYRLSEIHAALGRSQLTRLDRHIDRRRSIAHVYFQKFASVEQLILPYNAEWAENAYHLFPVEFTGELEKHRDAIYRDMKEAGIDVQVHYVPLHRMPLFSHWHAADFPNAETYFKRCLSLPLFCDLSYKDLDRISDTFLNAITQYLPSDLDPESSHETVSTDAPTDAVMDAEEPIPTMPSESYLQEQHSVQDELTEQQPAENVLPEQQPIENELTEQQPIENELTEQQPFENELTEQQPETVSPSQQPAEHFERDFDENFQLDTGDSGTVSESDDTDDTVQGPETAAVKKTVRKRPTRAKKVEESRGKESDDAKPTRRRTRKTPAKPGQNTNESESKARTPRKRATTESTETDEIDS